MYAIVKTGGKQYKVAPGDILEVEKLDVEEGKKVALDVICIVDGSKVETDPAKAAKTKVEAVVLEQFKGDKQLVFKFKKRKNYKRTRGHRQNLTRIQIANVGSEKAEVKASANPVVEKKTTKKAEEKPAEKTEAKAAEKPVAEKKTATKKTAAKSETAKAETAEKKTTAKKTTTKTADKPAAEKKPAAKKTADSSEAE